MSSSAKNKITTETQLLLHDTPKPHDASLRVQNSGQCKLVTRSIGGHMANDVKSSMFLPNRYVLLGHMTHLALCNV